MAEFSRAFLDWEFTDILQIVCLSVLDNNYRLILFIFVNVILLAHLKIKKSAHFASPADILLVVVWSRRMLLTFSGL